MGSAVIEPNTYLVKKTISIEVEYHVIKSFEKPIYVTRPYLPPLEEFTQGLQEIWENRWLTNNGPILQRFTQEWNAGSSNSLAGDGNLR
jgi:hypothetical protein